MNPTDLPSTLIREMPGLKHPSHSKDQMGEKYRTLLSRRIRHRSDRLRSVALLWLGCAQLGWCACTPPASLAAKLHGTADASTYAKLGDWFIRDKSPACAADAYGLAFQKEPESAQYAYLFGLSLLSAGKPRQAVGALQRSLQLEPDAADPHLVLGAAMDQLGLRSDAELQWRLALSFDPHAASGIEGLSRDLLADGNYVRVIEMLRPLEAARQLSAAAAIDLSVAYTKSGLAMNAFDVLEAANHAYPSSIPVIEALAAAMVLQGRYREAGELLAPAAKSHSDNMPLQIHYLRVLVLANSPSAEPLCKQLLARQPQQWELLYLMGLLVRHDGHVPEAGVWFERSLKEDPDDADAHFQLGMVKAELKKDMAARDEFERAIALGYGDPQVHYELGRAEQSLGSHEAAQLQFQLFNKEQLADLNQGRAATAAYKADQDQASGNFSQAAVDYREALRIDPTEPLLAYRLAMALDKTGDVAGERAALEQALRDDPQMAVAQNQLGYLDSVANRTDSAISHFRRAVQADPGYTKAWINLAASLCMESRWLEARSTLTQLLAIDPNNTSARELLERIGAAGTEP